MSIDIIKPYSVMVKWGEKVVGSGVLVKSNDNKCYLFTARHLFKGRKSNFLQLKESMIQKELTNISISKPSYDNDIFLDEILYFKDDLDLVVFSLKEEPPIQNLAIIKILKSDHQSQNYHFYGYPEGSIDEIHAQNTGHFQTQKYIQSNEEEKNIFRLGSHNNIDGGAVSGYSGSGIFIETKEKIEITKEETIENSIVYLVGILIRAKEGLSYYEGIDLSNIIDDINHKAHLDIPKTSSAIELKFTKNIKTKILERNKDDTFIQKIEGLEGASLVDFLDSHENELTNMIKKLADFYLLGGMHYWDNEKEKDAEKYFKLASKFNPSYKRYAKQYKAIKNDDELEDTEESKNYYHEGIIAFQHKEYTQSKLDFMKHLELKDIDTFEKLETHKYLSKIYEYEKMYSEAIQESKLVFNLYQDVNILDKVETYYRLSKLCLKSENDEIDALGYIEKGLDLLRPFEDQKDETLLDLKYKLKLLKDKILDEVNSGKTINSTLIDLVRLNPDKYMEEFLEAYLKTQNGEITPIVIYQKLQELHLDVKGIKNEKKN